MKKLAKTIWRIIANALMGILNTILEIKDNWEATVILLFSSIGLAYTLGNLPYVLLLPVWMEALPIIVSVGGVWILTRSIKHRLST